jgi:hypothetical protein
MSEKEEFTGSPMANAVDTALRLWGHTFHGITASRRENLLKISDPKFVSLLGEPDRFKTRQCGSLFVRTFIKGMMKEARDDQQLRIVSRGSGPPLSRGPGNASSARGASNSFHRNNSGRNGHYVAAQTTAVSTRVEHLEAAASTTTGMCLTHLFPH